MTENKGVTIYILGQFGAGKSTVAEFMREELETRGVGVVEGSDFEVLQELVAQDQEGGGLYSKVTEEGFVLRDNTLMAQARDRLIGTPPRGAVDIREVAVGGDKLGLVEHSMDDFVRRLGESPDTDETVIVYVNGEEERRFSRNLKRLRETSFGVPDEAMERFASGRDGAFEPEVHSRMLEEKGVVFEYLVNDENGLEGLQSVVKGIVRKFFGS